MSNHEVSMTRGESGDRTFFVYPQVEDAITKAEECIDGVVDSALKLNQQRQGENLPPLEGLPATDEQAQAVVMKVLKDHFKEKFLTLIVEEYVLPTDTRTPVV